MKTSFSGSTNPPLVAPQSPLPDQSAAGQRLQPKQTVFGNELATMRNNSTVARLDASRWNETVTYRPGDVVIAGNGNKYVARRTVTGETGPATSADSKDPNRAWEHDSQAMESPSQNIKPGIQNTQQPIPIPHRPPSSSASPPSLTGSWSDTATYRPGDAVIAGNGNKYVARKTVTGGTGPATSADSNDPNRAWEHDSQAMESPSQNIKPGIQNHQQPPAAPPQSSAVPAQSPPVPASSLTHSGTEYPFSLTNQSSTSLKVSEPLMYLKAQAVGLIVALEKHDLFGHQITQRISRGTGFLVDNGNFILTNNHVLSKTEQGSHQILLGYEKNDDGLSTKTPIAKFLGEVVATDPVLDYSLIRIDMTPSEIETFGFLEMASPEPDFSGQPIYMPNHGHSLKGIAYLDQSGQPAMTAGPSLALGKNSEHVAFHHTASGVPGTSGSPVISTKTHKVIGWHYGSMSGTGEAVSIEALSIDLIRQKIEPHFLSKKV